MSVVFDTLWWWRAEVEATPNPYTEADDNAQATTSTVPIETVYPSQGAVEDMDSYGYENMPYVDATFMDWNWLAGLQSDSLLDGMAPITGVDGLHSGMQCTGTFGFQRGGA